MKIVVFCKNSKITKKECSDIEFEHTRDILAHLLSEGFISFNEDISLKEYNNSGINTRCCTFGSE